MTEPLNGRIVAIEHGHPRSIHLLYQRDNLDQPPPTTWTNDLGALPGPLAEEIAQWTQDTNCGRRTAYGIYSFRNMPEKLMFAMRWLT